MPKGRKYPPDEERFWAKVQKTLSCWLWMGKPRNEWGYGQMRVNGKKEYPHRFSYILHNGSIPDGLVVCHSCDNPACVNPNHMFLGTHEDNMRDMRAKGRQNDWGRNGPGKPVRRYGPRARAKVNAG